MGLNDDVILVPDGLRQRLAKLGANVRSALSAAQLAHDERATTDQFFTLWEAIGHDAPADIGLRLASELPMHLYDVASLAAVHSVDLRTALDKLARYKQLCGPKNMLIEPTRDGLRVRTEWLRTKRKVPTRLVDASLATLVVLARRGSDRPLTASRVELRRPPADEAMLRAFFACPVRFGAQRDALVFDRDTLAVPFVTHNESLLATLAPGLEAALEARKKPGFTDEVKAAVKQRMTGERPSVAKVARTLAMSPRTLQRRLEELGTSYQAILDDARHETARHLLREDTLSISEVAFLLGFEELNSFTRAFRVWEGITPLSFRNTTR